MLLDLVCVLSRLCPWLCPLTCHHVMLVVSGFCFVSGCVVLGVFAGHPFFLLGLSPWPGSGGAGQVEPDQRHTCACSVVAGLSSWHARLRCAVSFELGLKLWHVSVLKFLTGLFLA